MAYDSTEKCSLIWDDVMVLKYRIQNYVYLGIVIMMNVREKVMCDVIIESTKNEIGCFAEGVKVV